MVKFQLNIEKTQQRIFDSDHLPRVGDHIQTGDMIVEVFQVTHHESGTYPWVNAKCTHSGSKHDEWWVKVEPPKKPANSIVNLLATGGMKCVECDHFRPDMITYNTANIKLST
ncbi:hypothetical protein LCGC14_2800620 [marine sediment metagenome]|uniref:Uncharacterized protein n=1 Tax=marine sediment metagenome TaxID=412755 RepID=A0A0F8Z9U4_9ZZZZ